MFLSFTNNWDEDSIAIIENVEEQGSLAMSVLLRIGEKERMDHVNVAAEILLTW
jgi:hypothetical protein